MRTFTSPLTSRGRRTMRKRTTPLLPLTEAYFAARHDLAPKTARSYRDVFADFDRWCRSLTPTASATLQDLEPGRIDAYKAHRMKHGVRPGVPGSEHQAAK